MSLLRSSYVYGFMSRRVRHLLLLASLIVGLVPLAGTAIATAVPQSVLCDRRLSGAVIERRHFDNKCPRGWKVASASPVLCSRGAGLEKKATANRCPSGWSLVSVDQGVVCRIAGRSYTCTPLPSGIRPTATVPVTVPATTMPPTTTTLPSSPSFDARGWEAEILRLTNVERQSAGLNPLVACARLATAALLHSNRMLEGQFFSHSDPTTGTGIVDRIRSTGYLDSTNGWRVAENIAMGYSTASATMVGWMNSPGHRANILTPGFTHLGVGVSIGVWEAWRGTYGNWNSATMATQNFGFGGNC
jgi:uncharacterized protein YkwD